MHLTREVRKWAEEMENPHCNMCGSTNIYVISHDIDVIKKTAQTMKCRICLHEWEEKETKE